MAIDVEEIREQIKRVGLREASCVLALDVSHTSRIANGWRKVPARIGQTELEALRALPDGPKRWRSTVWADEKRNLTFTVCVSLTEHNEIMASVRETDEPVSAWFRNAALARARGAK